MRHEAAAPGVLEHLDRHLAVATEFARKRPIGSRIVDEQAAEDARARRGPRDLLDLGLAIDGEQPHAELEGARHVALLLDRVAEGDAVGRGAGREHRLDLGDRGRVEAGAEIGEKAQDLGRGICLHGVEDARVRQRIGEGAVILGDHVAVDDEARSVLSALAKKGANPFGHLEHPSTLRDPGRGRSLGGPTRPRRRLREERPWTTIACGSRLPRPRGGDAGFGRASKPRRAWRRPERSTTFRLVRRNDYRCRPRNRGSWTLSSSLRNG